MLLTIPPFNPPAAANNGVLCGVILNSSPVKLLISLVTIGFEIYASGTPTCKNQGPAYISDYSASWPKDPELDSNDFLFRETCEVTAGARSLDVKKKTQSAIVEKKKTESGRRSPKKTGIEEEDQDQPLSSGPPVGRQMGVGPGKMMDLASVARLG